MTVFFNPIDSPSLQIDSSGYNNRQTNPAVRDATIGPNSKCDDLQDACDEMESLFWFYMIKAMRATIPESGLFPKSNSHRIYNSMLDSRLSELMSEKSGDVSRMMFSRLNPLSAYEENNTFTDIDSE